MCGWHSKRPIHELQGSFVRCLLGNNASEGRRGWLKIQVMFSSDGLNTSNNGTSELEQKAEYIISTTVESISCPSFVLVYVSF